MSLVEINRDPTRRQLLWFGWLWFPAFYGAVGGVVFHRTGSLSVALVIWGAGAGLTVVGAMVPALMRLVFVGLSYAAFPIGWVVSHLVLLLLFLAVMTPIGWLIRLFGHDPMQRRFDRQTSSYWEPRRSRREAGDYFRQS